MKREYAALYALVLFLLLLPSASAKQTTMKLLAVASTPQGNIGQTADLSIDVADGTGKVYLDTFPFTKLDTQMSTRFANEIACDFLSYDCASKDFFYTIRAESNIIGGASAGAAITVMTVAHLSGATLSNTTAITGTINSGGLIGPVANIKEKIDAAAGAGIKKVLIPEGSAIANEGNTTINLYNYSREKGITLVEVSTLDEAMLQFTGRQFREKITEIKIDPSYENTMMGLAGMLCNRSSEIASSIKINPSDKNQTLLMEDALNYTLKANDSFKKKDYYSAASFCFAANTKYRFLQLYLMNMTPEEIRQSLGSLKLKIEAFRQKTEKIQLKTITDLEASMVVKERLADASSSADSAGNYTGINDTLSAAYDLAYSYERFFSAYAWSMFFGKPGKAFNINQESLKQSCLGKIAEAQERFEYASLYFPMLLGDIELELEDAAKDYNNKDFELCLFDASKAKAQADVIITLMGIEENQTAEVLGKKLQAIEINIFEQQKKGIFPILGYSDYEYAKSLMGQDQTLPLLYAEYALEFTNLDIYFDKADHKESISISVDKKLLVIFVFGFVSGSVLTVTVLCRRIAKKPTRVLKKTRQKR